MADSVLESPGLNSVLSADVPQLSCCRTEVLLDWKSGQIGYLSEKCPKLDNKGTTPEPHFGIFIRKAMS